MAPTWVTRNLLEASRTDLVCSGHLVSLSLKYMYSRTRPVFEREVDASEAEETWQFLSEQNTMPPLELVAFVVIQAKSPSLRGCPAIKKLSCVLKLERPANFLCYFSFGPWARTPGAPKYHSNVSGTLARTHSTSRTSRKSLPLVSFVPTCC